MDTVFENIFALTDGVSDLSPLNFLIAVGSSLILGFIISATYIKTAENKRSSKGFALTLVIMSAVITIIIILIGNSVARAFSLAGAFQIARFRSAPGSAKDITFVLLSMATGLCTGTGYIGYGAAAVIILCVVTAVLSAVNFGKRGGTPQTLKILIPEDLNYKGTFDAILEKYTESFAVIRIKTVDLGSLFEVHYSLVMKPNADEKALIDEVRVRNGNLTVTLILDDMKEVF
ncbi:MAG: DUF4956 domain-containing protein [Oscillospiraceae bacterium]|nr:DUF4956 domain-containing protein [Oscillospiraceae bacterium]